LVTAGTAAWPGEELLVALLGPGFTAEQQASQQQQQQLPGAQQQQQQSAVALVG